MSQVIRFLVTVAILLVGGTQQVFAQSPCNYVDRPADVIAACTRLIEARKLWNGEAAKPLNMSGMLTIRGATYEKVGDFERALRDHNESVRLSPTIPWTFSMRGSYFYNRHEYDKALSDFNQALALDPRFTDALLNRGGLFLLRGDTAHARTDFDTLIRINPKYRVDVLRKELNMHWQRYLHDIEAKNDYANWLGPPVNAYRDAPR